ncbi:MAG: FCD domain-containing protein [Planctomycetaceae bacterium]|nr:FCD domain-containing protein [Planctomycetaceae bacterium]
MNHQAKLSERIVQDVVDRLATGRELPFRLNVLGIAQHYGISRTPVREAIGELLRMGKLAKLPNGRLAPGSDSRKTSVTVPESASLAASIADTLLNSIGELSIGGSQTSTGDTQLAADQVTLGDRQLATPMASIGRGLANDSFHRGPHVSLVGDTQLVRGHGVTGDSQLTRTDECTTNDSNQSCHHSGAKTDTTNLSNGSVPDLQGSGLCVPTDLMDSKLCVPAPPVPDSKLCVPAPPDTKLCVPAAPPAAPDTAQSAVSVPTSASHGPTFVSILDFEMKWSQMDWKDGVRRGMIEEIVRLSLQGHTTFLREQIWSDRLRIGRGVLRQILSELAGLGFVEHVARRGWQVRPFDTQAMLQYLEIREVLELHALELAKDRLDPDRLRVMLAGNPSKVGECSGSLREPTLDRGAVHYISRPEDRGSLREPMLDRGAVHDIGSASLPESLNNEIHGYLIELSNNRYIADFFARHSTYYSQLFEMATVETGWRDTMAQQHREILAALLDQDWSRAKKTLAHHIRAQKPVVQQLLKAVRGTSPKDSLDSSK